MIKSVAYFPLQCAKNSVPVMSAMLDSLRRAGISVQENSWDADAVIKVLDSANGTARAISTRRGGIWIEWS